MKKAIIGSCAVIAVLLLFASVRLSDETLAVVVGAVCGISAAIPVSIGLLVVASQSFSERDVIHSARPYILRATVARGEPVGLLTDGK